MSGRRTRRFSAARDGAAAVEFALLGVPFFLLLFALIESSLVFVGDLSLQHAVDRVGREVRTGQNRNANLDAAAFKQRICDKSVLIECENLAIDLRSYDSYAEISRDAPIKDGKLDRSSFGYDVGGSDEIMALRAFYVWPLYTDLIRKTISNVDDGYLVSAASVFRTEPF